jgi:hypothetical protein
MGSASLALAGLALLGARPAWAAQDDSAACAAVVQAVRAVGEAEQFHSRLVAHTPARRRPLEQERFVLGDVVYTNSPAAGRWVKLPMTAERRRELAAGLETYPPQDCHDHGVETVAGVPMQVFTYHQVLPGEDGAAQSIAPGRLWVAADGRPRRYESQHGDMRVTLTFDYDRISPPFGR